MKTTSQLFNRFFTKSLILLMMLSIQAGTSSALDQSFKGYKYYTSSGNYFSFLTEGSCYYDTAPPQILKAYQPVSYTHLDVYKRQTDNCTPADQLKFSWTRNMADTILEVNCDYFILKRPAGDTILDTVPYFGYERYFTIWVTDASGNQDTCNGNRSLAFLDTLNVCGKNRLVSGFHGQVTTVNGYNIPEVIITASGDRKLLDKSCLLYTSRCV